jgi:hypothetical protein
LEVVVKYLSLVEVEYFGQEEEEDLYLEELGVMLEFLCYVMEVVLFLKEVEGAFHFEEEKGVVAIILAFMKELVYIFKEQQLLLKGLY